MGAGLLGHTPSPQTSVPVRPTRTAGTTRPMAQPAGATPASRCCRLAPGPAPGGAEHQPRQPSHEKPESRPARRRQHGCRHRVDQDEQASEDTAQQHSRPGPGDQPANPIAPVAPFFPNHQEAGQAAKPPCRQDEPAQRTTFSRAQPPRYDVGGNHQQQRKTNARIAPTRIGRSQCMNADSCWRLTSAFTRTNSF